MSRPPKARVPLQQAALRLFVEQGIDGTGIRDVAKAAGVSEAALYRHWTSKEALVQALYHEHLDEIVALLDAAVAAAPTLAEGLRGAVAALYALYDREPLVFRFVLLAQADLRRVPEDHQRTPLDVVDDLARRAAPPGVDHRHLAAAWTGLFLQTAQFVLLGRLEGPLTAHAPVVADLALRLTDE